MTRKTMTYSKKDGLVLDIPNKEKMPDVVIANVYEEICNQIFDVLPHSEVRKWEANDCENPEMDENRVIEVTVDFPKGFLGKNNPEIQVKTGCLETYEDIIIVSQAAQDKADEFGYIEPNFDKL
jgi:hypothetical protein